MKFAIKAAPWIVGLVLLLCVDEVLHASDDVAWLLYILSVAAGIAIHYSRRKLWQLIAPLHDDYSDYTAIAEEEIDAATFDDDLWSEALIKANGNESLRTIAYMKLRAAQLLWESED